MVSEHETTWATIQELRARWLSMPEEYNTVAQTLLEDATQYLIDIAPQSINASKATRRRIVCSIVKRALESQQQPTTGFESFQMGIGPFQESYRPINPHGDFYLTMQEKKALGVGKQRAATIDLLSNQQ